MTEATTESIDARCQSFDTLCVPANSLRVFVPEPEYTLRIGGSGGKPLVSIKPDGTVIVHEPGADREAAKAFYEALQIRGRSLVARIAQLETELAAYRTNEEK